MTPERKTELKRLIIEHLPESKIFRTLSICFTVNILCENRHLITREERDFVTTEILKKRLEGKKDPIKIKRKYFQEGFLFAPNDLKSRVEFLNEIFPTNDTRKKKRN